MTADRWGNTLPVRLVRAGNWLLTHTLYRVRAAGAAHVPAHGGALLVCNHVSLVDAFLLTAAVPRPVRFLIYRSLFRQPLLGLLARSMRAIPIARDDEAADITAALETARRGVRAGDLVCIFAEGHITRTGNMLPFQEKFTRIMAGLDAPIIPVHLDRVWGSIFSFEEGRFLWKLPRFPGAPVRVTFGAPLPATATVTAVRTAVLELGAEAFRARQPQQLLLQQAFIREVKAHPFRFCMADEHLRLNYLQTLAGVLALRRRLFPQPPRAAEEKVGVLLPASCAAALVNGAILCAGRVPVNLNFTAGAAGVDFAVRQCGITMIVTSRQFLDKLGLPARPEAVFLEEVQRGISRGARLLALVTALLPSPFIIRNGRGERGDMATLATVIYSSGSSGEPKGVMLTHGNIYANTSGLAQVLGVGPDDIVLSPLPFFHSFGFTAALCFPVGAGMGMVYHANPLAAEAIGRLAAQYRATIILGTPTFLAQYLKKCTPAQFATLRLAIVGAEKLQPQLADAFRERFGVVPYEGYGATELSPIVAMGIAGYESPDGRIRQVGHKPGTVGHPIPGVAVKTVEPESGADCPAECPGLLLVKGPNVMRGYLARPDLTASVMRDGWYVTGDIAVIDRDGFIRITGRLSRFSKIAGEMVPHARLEEELHAILGATETVCAVTAVPDAKRGERLVVLYRRDVPVPEAAAQLTTRGLPNLWLPARDAYHAVDALPLLGSGKLDLQRLRALAAELAG